MMSTSAHDAAPALPISSGEEFTVVIASAGRRLYIVEWFRQALKDLGLRGRIITTDASTSSAALSAGDLALPMPPYSSSEYEEAMVAMVREHGPRMLVSLNDYEIEKMAEGLGARLESMGVIIPGVPASLIGTVTDKFQCASYLAEQDILAPETKLGVELLNGGDVEEDSREFVVKHRWGSGSSGLQIVARDDLESAIEDSMKSAPSRESVAPEESVVVQPRIEGTEYGADVVGSMRRGYGLAGVLVRKKLRMRAGETDQATTVDAAPFAATGERLYRALQPIGLIDVDVLVNDHGEQYVIDINPRFGGGYPFNHIAGARVPKMYIEGAVGGADIRPHLEYASGVAGGKYEGIRKVEPPAPTDPSKGTER